MRQAVIGVLVLALGAVALSVVLVPRDGEVALMNVRASDFRSARLFIESGVLDGAPAGVAATRPAEVAIDPNTRANVHLNFANVDGAISVLEQTVAGRPGDPAAQAQLLQVYEDGQQTGRQFFALREAARGGSPAAARTLADLVQIHGTEAQRIEALEMLAAQGLAAEAEILALAKALAGQGDLGRARAVLTAQFERDEGSRTGELARLFLALAVAQEDAPALAAFIERAPQPYAGEGSALAVASGYLIDANRPDLAVRLVESPVVPLHDCGVQQIAAVSFLEARRAGDGLAMFGALRERGQLCAGATTGYAELAMAAGEPLAAAAYVVANGVRLLPIDVRMALAQAVVRQDAALAAALVGDNADAANPVLVARLSHAGGDTAALEARVDTLLQGELATYEALDLADLLVEVGRHDDVSALVIGVLATLAPAANDGGASSRDVFETVAGLYVRMQRFGEGLQVLSRFADVDPDAAAVAQMRLAAATGQSAQVLAWLDAASEVPAPLIADLIFLAADGRHDQLALDIVDTVVSDRGPMAPRLLPRDGDLLGAIYEVARRQGLEGLALRTAKELMTIDPRPENRQRLARSLMANGRPEKAVEHYRRLAAQGVLKDGEGYVAALGRLDQTDELTRYVRATFNPQSADAHGSLVFQLMGLGAHEAVVRLARQYAVQAPQEWMAAFAEASVESGQASDFEQFVLEVAARGGANPAVLKDGLERYLGLAPLDAAFLMDLLAAPPVQYPAALIRDHLRVLGTVLLAEIVDAGLSEAGSSSRVAFEAGAVIMEGADLAPALDSLRKLAAVDDKGWLDTYLFAAQQAGQVCHAARFLASELDRGDLADADKLKRGEVLSELAPGLAVEALGPRLEAVPALSPAYLRALTQVGTRDDLSRFLFAHARADSPLYKDVSAAVHDLVARQDWEVVLPALQRLAAGGTENWVWVYLDAARQAGREGDAVGLLYRQLSDSSAPPEEVTARAYEMITLDPVLASKLFRELAQGDQRFWYPLYDYALSQVPPMQRGTVRAARLPEGSVPFAGDDEAPGAAPVIVRTHSAPLLSDQDGIGGNAC